MNDIETRHSRILLGEYLDMEDRKMKEQEEIEERIKDAIRPGGEYDPYGYYTHANGALKVSWLDEALGDTSFEQQMELSALLRGGYDKQACDLIREVAKKYAESCARAEFEGK
jgi:hypothetical protein